MPHYRDGTPAAVGDQVYGHLYNTPGVVAGTLISITPGVDSCNAMVQYTAAVPCVEGEASAVAPRMAVLGTDGVRRVRGLNHGTEGPEFVLFSCADYCAVSELTKLSRGPLATEADPAPPVEDAPRL